MSPCMWLACASTMRKNWSTSARGRAGAAPSTAAAEPLMAASGVRSSWLTSPRNAARWRSSSWSGVRSCMVTTTETTAPSSARIGVPLTSIDTLRPSGTESSNSSARTVSPVPSHCARGNSLKDTSRPPGRRTVTTSSSASGGWSPVRSASTMRRASRLTETGRPVLASNTTTPTGEVSTRASRSARVRCSALWARCSAVWARALAMAVAAWLAKSTTTSSSSSVNSGASSFSARKKWPTCTSR